MRKGLKAIIIAVTIVLLFFLARGVMDLRSTLQVEKNRQTNEKTTREGGISDTQKADETLPSPLPPLSGFFPNNVESTPPEDL